MSSNHSSLFFPNNKIHCYSTSQICPSVNPTLTASHSIQFPFISDPVRGPFRVSSPDPHTPEEYTFHLHTVRYKTPSFFSLFHPLNCLFILPFYLLSFFPLSGSIKSPTLSSYLNLNMKKEGLIRFL